MSNLYWRADEAHEEETISQYARAADKENQRLDRKLIRLRTRMAIERRRWLP